MASKINASNTGVGGLISSGDASGRLDLQTADTTRMIIDVNGNVGIGKVPGNVLDIYKDTAGGNTTLTVTNPNVAANSQALAVFAATGAGGNNYSVFGQNVNQNTSITNVGTGSILLNAINATTGQLLFYTGNVERVRITPSGSLLITNAAGMGYGSGAGAGGSVTQATSKATAVTLNKPTGQIIMNNAALAAGVREGFLVNNSLVGPQDVVVVNALNNANYRVETLYVVSGGFGVAVTNMTAGSLSEALAIQFAIIKGAIT